MSTPHTEQLERCAGWVLGALDPAEHRAFEEHLAAGCAECEAELRRLSEGATRLAASAPAVTPRAGLRADVFARIRREGDPRGDLARPEAPRVVALPARPRTPWLAWGFAAAAALLAVTSITQWRTADGLRSELGRTQAQLEEARRWAGLVESGDARFVDLQLTPQGASVLRARAVYDPRERRAMLICSNFTPPSGSDYELWALRDGKPRSLGVIHADAEGRAVVKLADTGDPSSLGGFAVSLEKAGGSSSPDAPEGPVVLLGVLAGS